MRGGGVGGASHKSKTKNKSSKKGPSCRGETKKVTVANKKREIWGETNDCKAEKKKGRGRGRTR